MGYGMRHIECDHGSHWKCIDENRSIEEFVYQITNSEKAEYFAGRDVNEENTWPNSQQNKRVLTIVERHRKGLGGIVISALESDEESGDHYSIITAYPYFGSGTPKRVILDDINEDLNGVEGILSVSLEDGPVLSFFDHSYFKNKHKYKIGEEYDFILSGLAYQMEYAKPSIIEVERSEGARGLRDVLNKLGKVMRETDERAMSYEPVRISTEGMAAIIPQENATDYSIVGPVVNSTSFEMLGSEFLRINMVVARELSESKDIMMSIYVRRDIFQGNRIPGEGMNLSGNIWLQGFLAGTRQDGLLGRKG